MVRGCVQYMKKVLLGMLRLHPLAICGGARPRGGGDLEGAAAWGRDGELGTGTRERETVKRIRLG